MSTQTVKLNTGAEMPVVGLGVYMGDQKGQTFDTVKTALNAGYRHFDTAASYGTETEVGRAIRGNPVPRKEVFVTTKLAGGDHARVEAAFSESLKALDIEYIDLFLMHWPQASPSNDSEEAIPYGTSPTFVETWKQMEQVFKNDPRCRAIGVSNFSVKNLEILRKEGAEVVPAVNQVESHILLPQNTLSDYCKEKGIFMTAYSPLGGQRAGVSVVLREPILKEIGDKYGRSAGTVALSWLVQRGNWSVIPKSSNEGRMKDNLDLFKLKPEDFESLSKLHEQSGKDVRTCPSTFIETGVAFGWSAEDMGWERIKQE